MPGTFAFIPGELMDGLLHTPYLFTGREGFLRSDLSATSVEKPVDDVCERFRGLVEVVVPDLEEYRNVSAGESTIRLKILRKG